MSWRLLALAGLAAAGCALTSKGTPVEVSWYTPELVQPSEVNPASAPLLLLGYVRSGTALGQRIVWGDGAFQVGFYEDRRWTERPSEFVSRALRRALFESHRFQPALDAGPRLEVELVSFQEILTPEAHAGRVVLHVQLAADRVLFDDTISEEEPVAGPRFEDVVAAISRALDAASEEVARRALVALQPPQP
jgi:cholesterol transport system auxiliary component